MRRWNGWGDDSISVPLPKAALTYLHERAGAGTLPNDAALAQVVSTVPPSRLPADPRIDTNPETRIRHARGQSLPDWLALRFGQIDRVPDGVAFPRSSQDVADLLSYAKRCGASVVPYGGGTSVVGHVNPQGDAPVLTISFERMRRLLELDTQSRLARFEAGVKGPDLEAQLRERGYTLGHFPQSFEYSTLGGWIVTRSSGQQSLKYGRIEQLFAGARVETPIGTLTIPTFPASAAGTDVRELVLGSEGRLGIVTEATVRVRPFDARESFHGWFFPDWDHAERAVHALVHAGAPLSMIRLANEAETLTTLRMAGNAHVIALMERLLAMRGCTTEKCLLIVGANESLRDARRICRSLSGVYFGRRLGEKWRENRFRGVYLRNTLWEHGYAVDTVETAVDWPRVRTMMRAMQDAGVHALDGRVHAYTHLSHVYPQGSSVYSTFIFPLAPTYGENLSRWQRLKGAVSEAIVAHGGTISHQHGVGIDHKPYLHAEKGALGIEAMQALFSHFDPSGMMNPGKLC